MTTGLTLLGFRKNGQPIYLICGAADPPQFQPPSADSGGEPSSEDPPETDPGGDEEDDSGEDAPKTPVPDEKDSRLTEMRAKSRKDRAKYHAEIADLKAQIAKSQKQPGEPGPEDIRKEAQEQARTEVLHERALDKVEVAAAKAGFTEPEDARLFLAAHAGDFISGGKVDAEAISDAIDELVTKRPYLIKEAKGGKRFEGGGVDQGPRGTKPLSLDAQITEAQKAGDMGAVLALQMQKLTTAN